MQTLPNEKLDPQLQRIEADLFSRIAVVFRRCNHLVGFTLQDAAQLPDNSDLPEDGGLFVSDIQFTHNVSADEDDEICRFIDRTVAQMIAESPEAFDVLRDRTFAKVLH
jgi:hypothetical protein